MNNKYFERFISVANGAPVDSMPRSSLSEAVERAEMHAKHLRQNVAVLRVREDDVSVVHIAFYWGN